MNSENISPLKVMKSAAGYYLGHSYHDEEIGADLPYSRDSDYFPTRETAEDYLTDSTRCGQWL